VCKSRWKYCNGRRESERRSRQRTSTAEKPHGASADPSSKSRSRASIGSSSPRTVSSDARRKSRMKLNKKGSTASTSLKLSVTRTRLYVSRLKDSPTN